MSFPYGAGGGNGSGGMTGGSGSGGMTGGGGSDVPTSCDHVTAVLQINCNGCHTSPPQIIYANLDLVSASAIQNLVGQAAYTGFSGACSGDGDILNQGPLPATGILIDKINGTQSCGTAMPQGLPMMSASDIACVQAWANGLVAAAGTQ